MVINQTSVQILEIPYWAQWESIQWIYIDNISLPMLVILYLITSAYIHQLLNVLHLILSFYAYHDIEVAPTANSTKCFKSSPLLTCSWHWKDKQPLPIIVYFQECIQSKILLCLAFLKNRLKEINYRGVNLIEAAEMFDLMATLSQLNAVIK